MTTNLVFAPLAKNMRKVRNYFICIYGFMCTVCVTCNKHSVALHSQSDTSVKDQKNFSFSTWYFLAVCVIKLNMPKLKITSSARELSSGPSYSTYTNTRIRTVPQIISISVLKPNLSDATVFVWNLTLGNPLFLINCQNFYYCVCTLYSKHIQVLYFDWLFLYWWGSFKFTNWCLRSHCCLYIDWCIHSCSAAVTGSVFYTEIQIIFGTVYLLPTLYSIITENNFLTRSCSQVSIKQTEYSNVHCIVCIDRLDNEESHYYFKHENYSLTIHFKHHSLRLLFNRVEWIFYENNRHSGSCAKLF